MKAISSADFFLPALRTLPTVLPCMTTSQGRESRHFGANPLSGSVPFPPQKSLRWLPVATKGDGTIVLQLEVYQRVRFFVDRFHSCSNLKKVNMSVLCVSYAIVVVL